MKVVGQAAINKSLEFLLSTGDCTGLFENSWIILLM